MTTITSTTATSNYLRISGLATGLDTESMIKQLMDAERIPLTRLTQQRTLLEWKRDDYRDITNTLRSLRDEFMDVLKPASNMLSDSTYKRFAAESTNPTVVTATANATALEGAHTISEITSLATAANTASTAPVTKDLAGSAAAALDYTGANQLQITLDGVTKTISLRNGVYADAADLVSNGTDGLQDLIDNAFGVMSDGTKKITVTESAGVIGFSASSSKVTVLSGTSSDALSNLKFTSGASNRLNLTDTLSSLALKTGLVFDGTGNLTFRINGKDITASSGTTLAGLINQVNSSDAGVTMSYSELTDKFTITAKTAGAGDNLILENTGVSNFFGAPTNIAADTYSNGTDAEFTLDGVTTARNDNTFTVDGVTYTLNSTYNTATAPNPTPITVTINQDVDTIYDSIKAFVDKYNEVIGKINTELTEKYDRDYQPLTDEQKKDMSEDDIKAWETKAKTGLLRSDAILRSVVDRFRSAIYDQITGVDGIITDIGIKTSENYLDNGKLVIDETKLKDAIRQNPDKVRSLFNETSSISYSPTLSAADRTTRYNTEGIAQRLSDIIQDNIRTTRDADGRKGTLLEKAGLVGDITEFNNLMDTEIDNKNTAIAALELRLSAKEERYYQIFTALETAVSKMNTQSSWLSQQFS